MHSDPIRTTHAQEPHLRLVRTTAAPTPSDDVLRGGGARGEHRHAPRCVLAAGTNSEAGHSTRPRAEKGGTRAKNSTQAQAIDAREPARGATAGAQPSSAVAAFHPLALIELERGAAFLDRLAAWVVGDGLTGAIRRGTWLVVAGAAGLLGRELLPTVGPGGIYLGFLLGTGAVFTACVWWERRRTR